MPAPASRRAWVRATGSELLRGLQEDRPPTSLGNAEISRLQELMLQSIMRSVLLVYPLQPLHDERERGTPSLNESGDVLNEDNPRKESFGEQHKRRKTLASSICQAAHPRVCPLSCC